MFALDFMKAEAANDFDHQATLNEHFLPGDLRVHSGLEMLIPADRLNVEVSGSIDPELKDRFLLRKNGRWMVRFPVHPASQDLYRPLLRKFQTGQFEMVPTSSIRTVYAWDQDSVFLKLSLAAMVRGLGRVVPGWEIRRAVRITELAAMTDSQTWLQSGASIIPEPFGAYIKRREGLGFYVDEDQGDVFEHGFIARDASFLQKFPGKIVIPLFALFSSRDGKPPLIVQLWRKSKVSSFLDFIDQYLVVPFIRKNLYLMLDEGLRPQIHGQNVVLVLNKENHSIEHVLHRDLGSFKVDYKMRWAKGLRIDSLRTDAPDEDFGLSWATGKFEEYYITYFVRWIFGRGYRDNLKKYVPEFRGYKPVEELVRRRLIEETARYLNVAGSFTSATAILNEFIGQNPPRDWFQVKAGWTDKIVERFLLRRRQQLQIASLPRAWWDKVPFQGKNYLATAYGVIYRDGGDVMIAFHSTRDATGNQCSGFLTY